MEIRHILLHTPLLVEPIIKNLEEGADFAQLAQEHSACPSAKDGGKLGNMSEQDFPAEIKEALESAPLGTVVGPIETHHGIHILRKDN